MTETTDLFTAAGVDPDELTVLICAQCGQRPRLGSLTRCKVCLALDADRGREVREARAQAAHTKARRHWQRRPT